LRWVRIGLTLVEEDQFMTKTTMSSKGQINIPKAVRERLNLKAGTEISFDVQGDALVMKRLVRSHSDWRTMRGMFQGGADLLKDLTDNRAAEIARDNARLEGR
jgi:AbrB family looped-hinge helix DNA binding protein